MAYGRQVFYFENRENGVSTVRVELFSKLTQQTIRPQVLTERAPHHVNATDESLELKREYSVSEQWHIGACPTLLCVPSTHSAGRCICLLVTVSVSVLCRELDHSHC